MKHLAQALAILSRAETELNDDLSDAYAKAMAEIDGQFAFRLGLIQGAKKAIQARFAIHEAIIEDYFGELKDNTPKETTIRIRKSLRREHERKTRHA